MRVFSTIIGGMLALALGWLLWRVNGVIGDQALLLVFGGVCGLACAACVGVIAWVVADVRRVPPPAQDGGERDQWRAPVVIMLPGSTAPRALPGPAGDAWDVGGREGAQVAADGGERFAWWPGEVR